MSRCVRCPADGTVVVFETSGGSMTGPGGAPGSGPLTGRLYACARHADDIEREDQQRRAAERRRRRRREELRQAAREAARA